MGDGRGRVGGYIPGGISRDSLEDSLAPPLPGV